MASDFVAVPAWFSWENAGAGMAVADVDGDGRPDLVVLMVDDPPGQNFGLYRIGYGLGADGTVTGWGPWIPVPDWFGHVNADVGIAVYDIDGDGHLDLVVFVVDAPEGQNSGLYRIGHHLAGDGTVTGGWGPWLTVPDWFAHENQGADIAVADLNSSGHPDLVVVMVDAPPEKNGGYYRVGRDLAADGTVSGGWGPWRAMPDWGFWENQGAGAAVADLNGDGRPELLVFAVDNPIGKNGAYYTIGWDLDETGRVMDGWGPWSAVPDWRFWENQGGSAAVADLDGTGRPELMVFTIDNPVERNDGYYRVLDIVTDLDTAAAKGVWRLLDFDTEINPVHAALLHTGDVLFFSGSGNDVDRFVAHDFRTRVWRYPSARFDAPSTPIDLFCAGQAFLSDGRLLAAGGTAKYDKFSGLRDTLVFDLATRTWTPKPDMAGGRWYPTLLALSDGRMLAVSGYADEEAVNEVPEIYTDTPPGWSTVASPGTWPLYAHLFLLRDGRIYYAGGQWGGNFGVHPSVWNLSNGAVTVVPGLTAPDMRNQAASVLLPPAQDQRVMITGGGGPQDHQHGGPVAGVKDVCIVDLTAAAPAYRAVAALQHARMHLCATLLPDRTVLVTGGAALEENAAVAALEAEIFNPDTETWTQGAPARVPRLYHSVALLLPDGKVMTAGSNPVRKTEELRIELYWPPYLFRGQRPALTLASDQGHYGGTVTATTDASALSTMSLIRAGATTHSFDNEQRLVDLPFTNAAGHLTLTLPTQRTLAPPGWYLVFGVNNTGVPSRAAWLQLS
jgi:galactose oxidase-like protein